MVTVKVCGAEEFVGSSAATIRVPVLFSWMLDSQRTEVAPVAGNVAGLMGSGPLSFVGIRALVRGEFGMNCRKPTLLASPALFPPTPS